MMNQYTYEQLCEVADEMQQNRDNVSLDSSSPENSAPVLGEDVVLFALVSEKTFKYDAINSAYLLDELDELLNTS